MRDSLIPAAVDSNSLAGPQKVYGTPSYAIQNTQRAKRRSESSVSFHDNHLRHFLLVRNNSDDIYFVTTVCQVQELNPHTNLRAGDYPLPLLYRGGNEGSERFNGLPKVTSRSWWSWHVDPGHQKWHLGADKLTTPTGTLLPITSSHIDAHPPVPGAHPP